MTNMKSHALATQVHSGERVEPHKQKTKLRSEKVALIRVRSGHYTILQKVTTVDVMGGPSISVLPRIRKMAADL